jgi:hypothetical protein
MQCWVWGSQARPSWQRWFRQVDSSLAVARGLQDSPSPGGSAQRCSPSLPWTQVQPQEGHAASALQRMPKATAWQVADGAPSAPGSQANPAAQLDSDVPT